MALLFALADLAPRGRSSLAVVHVNHGIRGSEADQDAAFVRAQCKALGVPLLEGAFDVPAAAKARGLSLEMAAREVRYAFFRTALDRTGGSAVATAHTADDQAETVLLKLLRGAGPRGLSGMAARATALGVPVVRPLLAVRRPAIESYLNARGGTWREDRTNSDTALLRNRVRHELLPLLEARYNPRIREILTRTASILGDEEDWLQPLAERELAAALESGEEGGLETAGLKKAPPALCRRAIRAWLMRQGLPEELLDFDLVERLERLLKSAAGTGAVDAGAGLRVVSEYGRWRLAPEEPAPPAVATETTLQIPGVTGLPAWGVRIRVVRANGYERLPAPGLGRIPCRAWLDARVLDQGGLRIRAWRPGDRLALPGGTRKLQDLFTDAKVPREGRGSIPVLLCGVDIVWVAGGPVAAAWRVPSSGAPSLLVEIEPGP
jgi:tRNA(Ile)-lysidine synthase